MPSQSPSPSSAAATNETVSTVAFGQCRSERMAWYSASTAGGGFPSLPLAHTHTHGGQRRFSTCERRLSCATRLSSSPHWLHFSHWLQHIQPYISGMPISSAISAI